MEEKNLVKRSRSKEIKMLQERKNYLASLLEKMGEVLDITPTQHEDAVKRYEAVANYLKEDKNIAKYDLHMYPQGSFALGTVTKPDSEDDELDIDLVCELKKGTHHIFTQKQLKKLIGDRLLSGMYKEMVCLPDGRRCWRIDYAEATKFHLDILASIPDGSPAIVGWLGAKDYSDTAISITDKEHPQYDSISISWPKSNPRAYQTWFREQMLTMLNESKRMFSATNKVKIDEVPDYKVKTPLQRAIQLMKRHRNEMFCKSSELEYDDKPISIIITTLAAKAYSNEANLYDALMNILEKMPQHIERRYVGGKYVTWVENPVDHRENFADKWEAFPVREKNFYIWIEDAKKFFAKLLASESDRILNESLRNRMGDKLMTKTFSAMGDATRILRDEGKLTYMTGTGMIGQNGDKIVPKHTPHGNKE